MSVCQTVTIVTTEMESFLTATRSASDIPNHFLTVAVTVVLNDGTVGPSSLARVGPKLTAGQFPVS